MAQAPSWNFDGIPDAASSGLNLDGIPDAPKADPQRSPVEDAIGSTQIFPGITLDMGRGAVREVGRHISQAGDWLRKKVPALDRGPSFTFNTESQNTQEKVGAGIANALEFYAGGEVAGGAAAALKAPGYIGAALKGLSQGGAGYGITKAQGGSDTGATIAAGISAVAPIASYALTKAAPKIAAEAENKLARVFARGVENAGPEIQYGLKTGDIAPDVAEAARIVHQAASDTLQLPLQASWGKWMTTAGKDLARNGEDLGTALKGPLGEELLFKQPIVDALDDLVAKSATHLAQLGPYGRGTGSVVYNQPLFNAVETLKQAINASSQSEKGYGPMISIRNLSDLKQTWDKAVYGLSTAGKVAVSPEVLTATAQKEAMKTGADAIRRVFDEKVPTIHALNQAASHAYRLQDLVRKLHKVSPGMGNLMSTATHTLGAVGGAAAGQQMGGHSLWGIMAGGAAANALQRVFDSPLWQTFTPVMKDRLAYALATGRGDDVLKILAPVLSTGVAKTTPPQRQEAR